MNLQRFVFLTGIYNFILATSLLFPAFSRDLLGLQIPYPGDWMIAGFLYFTAAILVYCSSNIDKFAAIIYYEGLLRLAEAGVMIHAALIGGAGQIFLLAAAGDILIGLVYIIQLNRQTGASHSQLILGRA